MIITKAEALAQGMTASNLRTIARSLDRRAGYSTTGNPRDRNAIGPFGKGLEDYRPNFDTRTNRRNAAQLRALARSL